MNTDHLSAWEQEEYLLNQRPPERMRHLTECADCRAALQRLESGLAAYRTTAMAWSAESLATRSQRLPVVASRKYPLLAWRWAFAAVLPLVVLLTLLPLFFAHRQTAHPLAQISDDALLDQVDEQLSVAVPASMESLTHLVSAESNGAGVTTNSSRSRTIVQTN